MTAPQSRRYLHKAPLALASMLCAISTQGFAQSTFQYDPTHGSAVWDSVTANWMSGVWANNNHASFSGSGIAVDIDGNIVVNNLTFNSNGYVLHDINGTSGTLTFANNNTVSVLNASDLAEISEIIAGASWVKNGAGTLLLSGANTFSGAITVNAGTLKIGHAQALGSNSTTTDHIVGAGGTLDLNGFTLAATETFTDFKGTILNNSSTESAILGLIGPSTGTANLTVDGSGDIRLSQVSRTIITKNGTGTLTFDTNLDNNAAQLIANGGVTILAKIGTTNSRSIGSGLWINQQAVVKIGAANGTGNNADQIYSSANVTLSGNGSFELNGFNESFNGLLGASGRVINGAASGTATLSLGENHGTADFHGLIANNGGTGTSVLALRKIGRGTQVLTNQNTYTGLTTVENGTLHLNFAHESGSSAPSNILHASSSLTMNASANLATAIFQITGEDAITNTQTVNNTTIQGAGRVRFVLNGASNGGAFLNMGAITYNDSTLVDFVTGTNTRYNTTSANRIFSGRATMDSGKSFAQISNGQVVAFDGDLVHSTDTSIPQLTGYSSTKTLRVDDTSTGVVKNAPANALQLASILFTGTANRTLDLGSNGSLTLGLGGTILRNATAGSVTIGQNLSEGTITAGTSASQTLAFNNANAAGNFTINSSIINNGAASTSVIYTGAAGGRTTVNGNNTYSGTTYVSAGHILRITHSSALGTGGALGSSGTTLGEGSALELEGNITVGNEALQVWGTGVGSGGAIRNISGDNTWGGNVTMSANSRIASDSGTLTFDVASGSAIAAGNFELLISGNGDIAIFDSLTQGGSNNNHIIKEGAGTLTLSGNNTFSGTGTFYIRTTGKVIATHNNALGGNSGKTQVEATASLEFQGSITTNENITINNTLGQAGGRGAIVSGQGSNTLTGIVTIDNGSGSLNARANTTLILNNATSAIIGDPDANSTRTVLLNGEGHIIVAGGGIKNGAGAQSILNVAKEGTGKLTLSGANTYTGTTSLSFGTVSLDYSNANNSKLADGTAATLRQVAIDLVGGSHQEVVLSTSLVADSKISIQRSSGTSTLNLNEITVGALSSLEIAQENLVRTDTLNKNGILGGWATIKDVGWATNANNAADSFITAYTGYSDLSRLGGNVADNTAANYRIVETGNTSGNIALANAVTQLNTLLMSASSANPGANAATIDMASKTLRFGTDGGIMMLSGANGLTLGSATGASGGTLTAGGNGANTAGTLALINHSLTQSMVINSVIANNGTGIVSLRKDGAGTLELRGNNTFTGKLVSTGGTIKALGNAASLGAGAASLHLANTTLHLVNNSNTDYNRATTINGDTTVVIDRASAGAAVTHSLDALTFTENFVLTVKKGDNITSGIAGLVFDGRHTTGLAAKAIDSTFNVDQNVQLTLSAPFNSGTAQFGHITKNGLGTLVMENTRSYWEGINFYLNEGKLEVRHAVALGDDSPANGPIHAGNNTVVQLTNNTDSNFMSPLNVVGASASVIVSRASSGSSIAHTMDNLYLGSNTLNVSSNETVQDSASLTFSGASTIAAGGKINTTTANVILNNTLSGKGGTLEKLGQGVLQLNAANTYTGTTTVTAGELQVNNVTGSAVGTGHVTVKAGAILSGTGNVGLATLAQNITLESLSILRVGRTHAAAGSTAEKLTLSNSNAGQIELLGTVQFDLFGNNGALNPLTQNDVLQLISDKSILLGGTLAVNDVTGLSTNWTEGSAWQIFDFSQVDASVLTSGAFSSFELPTLDAAYTWNLSQLYTNGILSIAAVPEPSRFMLLATAFIGWCFRRKRGN